MSTSLDQFAAQFDAMPSGAGYKAICPAHDDQNPSLSIFENEKGVICLKCFAGCSPADIYRAKGVPPPSRRASGAPPLGEVVATYEYSDEHGVLRARKLRYEPKTFSWQRPDGRGGFLKGDGGFKHLYRLPELLAAPADAVVYVVEGEKSADAIAALGLVATCGPSGAGSPWLKKYDKAFKNRRVVVFGDQDEPGSAFAARWAQHIHEAGAAEIRLVPYLPMIDHGGDVFDYLAAHAPHDASVIAHLANERSQLFTARAIAPAEYPNTESGDAEFFAAMYAEDLRFDHRRGRWLVADPISGLWLPDTTVKTVPMATKAMRERHHVAVDLTGDKKTEALAWALRGENRNRLTNCLALARSVAPLSDDGEHWDEDPFLLGTPNGVVDLRTGEHRRANPSERITMRVRVPFDPQAECPLWERTLVAIFAAGELFDQEEGTQLVSFLQRALGYTLTGDCREECCFITWGEGGNGKGTVMNTVAYLLADYHDEMPFSTLERSAHGSGIPNDVAKLDGKRYGTTAELNDVMINEARLKAITGRDPITARFLNREFFTFVPVVKIWIATNNKPRIVGQDDGIWRRIHLVPFTNKFEGAKKNAKLKDDLRSELPGILNWLVQGARLWQERGLDPPATVRAATAAYRSESNPITPFLEQRCVVGELCSVQAGAAWHAYLRHCEEANTNAVWRLSNKAFFKAMDARFPKIEQRGPNRSHVQVYTGVGLREPGEGSREPKPPF